jgi:glucosyl-3-phosphoglycerate synthase
MSLAPAARIARFARLRSFDHAAYPAARIAAQRELSVSVCLPARNEVLTIGPILEALMPLVARGAIDEVVVLDDSTDGTADVAHAVGAQVYRQSDLCPEYGAVCGKGDALWRGLSVLQGDLVCFLDADSERFGEHFACGLIGVATCERDVTFVKGYYRRPFRAGAVVMPDGGGRVTELTARPLLQFFYPELASFLQPLAGEFAARRDVLAEMSFVTGYGVDVALLIDAYRSQQIGHLAQVDLKVRQNRHKRLGDLVSMSDAVLRAVLSRVAREGRITLGGPNPVEIDERPAIAALPPAA